MQRVLTISLLAHWSAVFALMSVGAVDAPLRFDGPAGAFALWGTPTAHASVAALFLWAVLAALAGRAGEEGGSGEIVRAAFAAAVVTLTLTLLSRALVQAPREILTVGVQLAGLGATYLIIRYEERRPAPRAVEPDYSNAVARRLALGAAHGSMLTRLSGRGGQLPGNDA